MNQQTVGVTPGLQQAVGLVQQQVTTTTTANVLVDDPEFGYASTGKQKSSSGKKKFGLLPLLLCCCLIPAIICGIVALALIPVYLDGPDNPTGPQEEVTTVELDNLAELESEDMASNANNGSKRMLDATGRGFTFGVRVFDLELVVSKNLLKLLKY